MKLKTILKIALALAPAALSAGMRLNHNQTSVGK